MSRKTIDVVYILETFNRQLAQEDLTDKEKSILCTVLEDILFKTGNYAGFNYRYWSSVGCNQWIDAGQPDFPKKEEFILGPDGSEYNRFYYYSPAMQTETKRARTQQEEFPRAALASKEDVASLIGGNL